VPVPPPPPKLLVPETTSCGGFVPSRLEKGTFLEPAVVSTTSSVPAPVTSGVTSIDAHEPVASAPEEPTVAPYAGAFADVMVPSLQEWSETPWASSTWPAEPSFCM
jgi:hypothetical protein